MLENYFYLCIVISLARHIELLLLEHDCVIVPGFGGFIANHAEAKYCDSNECLFLPPYRTIGFNPQLQVNDGLLVQSYMTAYDASYPAAYLQMEKEIGEMAYELEMKGEYVLEHIGLLKKDMNQHLTFSAPENGILTPTLYGLYSYEIQSLQDVIKGKEINATLQEAASALSIASVEIEKPEPQPIDIQEPKQEKEVVIRLRKHWIDVGISVAAAVLLFFCFSYPAMKPITSETDTVVAAFPSMDKIGLTKLFTKAKPTPSVQTPKIEVSPATSPKPKAVKEEKPAMTENSTNTTTVTEETTPKKYTIVLASYISQKNAEQYIQNLAKSGFAEGRFVKGKVSRILYSGYSTENEAQNALAELRKQSNQFAEAWVLEL